MEKDEEAKELVEGEKDATRRREKERMMMAGGSMVLYFTAFLINCLPASII